MGTVLATLLPLTPFMHMNLSTRPLQQWWYWHAQTLSSETIKHCLDCSSASCNECHFVLRTEGRRFSRPIAAHIDKPVMAAVFNCYCKTNGTH